MASTTEPRQLPIQATHYLRKRVAFDTPGIGTAATVAVGVLPAGAIVVDTVVKMQTAFNAGSTNVLIVGTSTDDDEFVDADDVTEGGTAAVRLTTGLGYTTTANEIVYAQYTQTGTAATTGAADIIIAYVPDNDG